MSVCVVVSCRSRPVGRCTAQVFSFDELNLQKLLTHVQFNNYSKTDTGKYLPISMAGRDIMACAQTGSATAVSFPFCIATETGPARQQRPPCNALRLHWHLMSWQFRSGRSRAVLSHWLACCWHNASASLPGRLSCKRRCLTHYTRQAPVSRTVERISVSRCGTQCAASTFPAIHPAACGPDRTWVHLPVALCPYGTREADRMLDMGFEPQIRRIVEVVLPMPRTARR